MKIGENVALLTLPSPIPGGMAHVNLVLAWDDANLVLIDNL